MNWSERFDLDAETGQALSNVIEKHTTSHDIWPLNGDTLQQARREVAEGVLYDALLVLRLPEFRRIFAEVDDSTVEPVRF